MGFLVDAVWQRTVTFEVASTGQPSQVVSTPYKATIDPSIATSTSQIQTSWNVNGYTGGTVAAWH